MTTKIAAVLCATGLIASCGRDHDAAAAFAAASAPPDAPMVAVARVVRADLSRSLALTAEFEPFQEIDVMAKVTGYVKVINVDIGDRVREGQVIATLEIPEMQDELARAAAAI